MKVDLHLHSTYSWDSNVPINAYITKAEELNFTAISITDHNSIKSHKRIKELQSSTSVLLVPGQEISTKDGHLLAYGYIDLLPKNLSMEKTVEIAKSNGGYCIAAHPYDFFREGSFSKIFESDIDGFEILNASSWLWLPNYLAQRAYKTHQDMCGVANSDSHDISEFGTAWTEVANFESTDELFHVLKNGKIKGGRIGVLRKIKRFINRKISL